jgi:hypothetical protein
VLVPLYGFLKGDSIGLVLLVHDHDSIADVAACLQEAAACRVAPKPVAHVYAQGKRLDPALTVTQSGLQALDRVDVITEDAP